MQSHILISPKMATISNVNADFFFFLLQMDTWMSYKMENIQLIMLFLRGELASDHYWDLLFLVNMHKHAWL